MRPLVALRRRAPFDRSFYERDERFWPLERAALALGAWDDFPPVDALGAVFDGRPPVRFVPAEPRKRHRDGVDPDALYDARIALQREVPTRPRCWHDLMNALVWGTFPRAKRALHARQHRAISERLAPGARTLPPARTPELDALACLDEGGVVLLSAPTERGAGPILFGHAIYESLVLGVRPAIVAAIVLTLPVMADRGRLLAAVDGALAAAIEDRERLQTPRELRRVSIEPRAGSAAGVRVEAQSEEGAAER